MIEYNFSSEPLSASMLAKSFSDFDIKRSQIISFLISRGFIDDIKTITELGLANGISYKYNDIGLKWPVYDITIQRLILNNIDKVKSFECKAPAYKQRIINNGVIISPSCSLTFFCNNNEFSIETAKRILKELGYIYKPENEKTFSPTKLGISKDIIVTQNKRGFKKVVYPSDIQREVLVNLGIKNIKEIQKAKKEINLIDIEQKLNINFDGLVLDKYPKLGIKNFVIIDTETTGSSRDDEIIEFAVIDTNGIVLYHSTFEPTIHVSQFASRVNHLTNEVLIGSPKFAEEWEKIKEAIGNKKLLGHNLSFDKRLTAQTLERYGLNSNEANEIFKEYYDSMKLAKKHIVSDSYSLENLAHMVGITRNESHRATDDCIMTLEFLNRLEIILQNK